MPAVPPAGAALINTYSTRNLGDAAILRATASLVPGGRADAVVRDAAPLRVPGVDLVGEIGSASLRVSVGGDIFNNSRPHFVTRSFVRNVVDLARRPRQTISFGQTVPSSCRGLALELLARTLRRVACVVVRDEESRSLLAAKGVDAKLSWDIAFTTDTTSSARERAARLLANSRLRPEHTVLVSVRPFDAMYPGDQERFERQIEALAARLMARGHDVGLIIQSDVAVWDTDRAAAARIEARDPRIKVVDCLADTADPDPVATLLALMELANIVVGIRYHTTVLRLAAGRQPFNLYYSRKGADLQRRLGLAGAPIGSGLEELACEIERTADRSFDAAAIRRDVRDHFADAVRLAA